MAANGAVNMEKHLALFTAGMATKKTKQDHPIKPLLNTTTATVLHLDYAEQTK